MRWLDKLEKRFGGFYIPGLMTGVVLVQGAVWALVNLFQAYHLYTLLTLSWGEVLKGQVWRLFSFLFVPSLSSGVLMLAISLYFYYFIGSALENRWGGFRFNIYVLVGLAGAWLAAALNGAWGNGGILLSLFFAFAMLYPEMQVLLFFVIPVKVKWLGLLSAVFWVGSLVTAGWLGRAGLVLELLPFWLFFGPEAIQRLRYAKRRRDWQRNFK